MKTLKIFLMLFFAIHFIVITVVGFSRFSELTTTENDKVNSFGQVIIKKSKWIDNLNLTTKDAIFFYSLFTGTNRGYAFFSPNVTSKKLELSFKSGDKIIEMPFRSVESDTKFFGANLYFNSNLDKIKERDSFLQSISTSFFNRDLNMKDLDVYLNLSMYSDINYTRENGLSINKKSMLGFRAKKN
ncbi:hypothetical protein [Flavobacterium sp. J27]|uniref:hypothetical protein n=1 Tax=Flavobacterium sp. J27 TaxID=2060419 RepID=UPI001031065D|nr:hypothetical protein [Flavobacterium sp. J27]